MPNIPNFSIPWVNAAAIAGTAAFFVFPALMAAFVFVLVRRRRPVPRLAFWFLGIGSAGLILAVVSGFARLAAGEWLSVALLAASLVLCGLLLRQRQGRPLQGLAWGMLASLLVMTAFLPFAIYVANLAVKIAAYSNPNEAEVRAALARDPSDPAAHSSLAQIDERHRDYAGEIAEWRQVLRAEPDNEEALLLLGGRLSQQGHADEARPLFQKLAAKSGPLGDAARKWLARHGSR